MRFDDSLKTVLAADTSTAFGVRAAFRQLADLIARRRVAPDAEILARLETLRGDVPVEVRAAVARGLALAEPPAALVRLFANDVSAVAGAVLRASRLDPDAWDALIPDIGPFGRSVLRRRDDLPPSAIRALGAFAATDLALADARPVAERAAAPSETAVAEPDLLVTTAASLTGAAAPGERFEIADLVSRIETFQRDRVVPDAAAASPVLAFRFETDAAGTIRWCDTGPRGVVIGLRLRHDPHDPAPVVDGAAAGAFRKRAPIGNARMSVPGPTALAGEWRIAATPMFDAESGRFQGYRGHARRPQPEEVAVRGGGIAAPRADATQVEGLRRLVHELRTPTNAIAGFSELIETEMMGPVPPHYRERAGEIRRQVGGLLGAIDDLELAARLDGNALDTRPVRVDPASLAHEVLDELMPLILRRGCTVHLDTAGATAIEADDRATGRLVSRLLATLIALAAQGEDLTLALSRGEEGHSLLGITRPRALFGLDDAALFALDASTIDGATPDDLPLLGVGFALRLVRNLAGELGGRLVIDADSLTVILPAALNSDMEQVRSTFT